MSDERGSVRLVVNAANGDVVQRMDYGTWGVITDDTKGGFQPFGFAGGLHDRDTHLTHFGARDYDANIGRWTAKDPIVFNDRQTDLYAYAGNDPINRIDSNGEIAPIIIGAVAGAIIGGAVNGVIAHNLNPQISNGDLATAIATGAITGAISGALATVGGLGAEVAVNSALGIGATSTTGSAAIAVAGDLTGLAANAATGFGGATTSPKDCEK